MLPNAFCLRFGGLINNMYHTTYHLRYIRFIFVTCININIPTTKQFCSGSSKSLGRGFQNEATKNICRYGFWLGFFPSSFFPHPKLNLLEIFIWMTAWQDFFLYKTSIDFLPNLATLKKMLFWKRTDRGWLAWGWWLGVVLFYKNSPLIGQKHAACIYTQLNIVHTGYTIQFQQQSCDTVCLSCLTSILRSDESGTNPIPGYQFQP